MRSHSPIARAVSVGLSLEHQVRSAFHPADVGLRDLRGETLAPGVAPGIFRRWLGRPEQENGEPGLAQARMRARRRRTVDPVHRRCVHLGPHGRHHLAVFLVVRRSNVLLEPGRPAREGRTRYAHGCLPARETPARLSSPERASFVQRRSMVTLGIEISTVDEHQGGEPLRMRGRELDADDAAPGRAGPDDLIEPQRVE